MDKKTPTIGPGTTKMLEALKTLESAREMYYSALQERGGESFASGVLHSNANKWDAVAGLLKDEITYSVEVWAVGGCEHI